MWINNYINQISWSTSNVTLVHSVQAKAKYEKMALKIRDYKVKKFEHWTAETERNLPLLIKMPLLLIVTSKSPIQAESVCISCILLLFFVTVQNPTTVRIYLLPFSTTHFVLSYFRMSDQLKPP